MWIRSRLKIRIHSTLHKIIEILPLETSLLFGAKLKVR